LKDKRTQVAIPLGLWLLVLIIIVVLFILSQIIFDLRDQFVKKNTKSTKSLSQLLPVDSSIFIFGSSLTKNALQVTASCNPIMKSYQSEYIYNTLYKPGVNPHDFVLLMKQAINRKDCIVFIEANMFIADIHIAQSNQINFLQYHRYRLSRLLKFLLKNPSFFMKNWLTVKVSFKNKDSIFNKYSQRTAKFRIRDLKEINEWLILFKEASKNNVKVFLLDIPRSQKARSYLPDGFETKFSMLMKTLEDYYGVKFISFPYLLDYPKYYIDAAHMNENGKEIYIKWFQEKLKTLVKNSEKGQIH